MDIEQRINYTLNKVPYVKKGIKRIYQRTMYAVSPKIKSEGDITRVSPNDPNHEFFFGYYDKSPWDATDRYVLCLKARDTWSDVSPKEKADILIIDTELPENNSDRIKKVAETRSWNVQQGCMAQWLGPDFSSHIIYNDCRGGKYVAIIRNLISGSERIIPAPVYTVSADGKYALTLDFSRLYNLRPGYGYYNVPEKTKGTALPEATAVWKVDLESGEISDLISYYDFFSVQPRLEMQEKGAIHKVNHLMINPNGKRCAVLYRWFVGQQKYTRLITFDVADGHNMYVLSDDNMVSHFFWKDDEHILAFENKKISGPGYYLMKDRTQEFIHLWPHINNDGHPSYSPNRQFVITDSYPDRTRMQTITLLREKVDTGRTIVKVFSPFKYDNDTRCDLHPRWNRKGTKICFDSVYEGHRGLYEIDIENLLIDPCESGFDMDQIRFIMPLHGFYNQLIQKSGYDIKNPYLGNQVYWRIFREIDFRLKYSDKEKWYNKENITDKKAIVVYDPLITPDYMNWLVRKNPQAKVFLCYINKVTENNNPNNYDRDRISIWTGDRGDSIKYGLNYWNGISYFKVCKVNKVPPKYDIFFVGKDKGRLDQVLELKSSFEELGLKVYFHIVAEKKMSLKRNPHYKKFMPYDEVLNKIGESRSILYLSNGAQDGITIRVMESLIHKVKLITDNNELKKYDFYTPDNIFILGERDLSELPTFLSIPYKEVTSTYLDSIYFEDMIRDICLHS